jgi:hypothetical protein
MRRFDESLARPLNFGGTTTTSFPSFQGQLRLAARPNALSGPLHKGPGGPDKYKALEHRRRQAQINARRLLEV